MIPVRMTTHKVSQRGREERGIVSARIVLAVSVCLSAWLDPDPSNRYLGPGQWLLVFYACYASVLAALMWQRIAGRWFAPVTHLIDGAYVLSLFLMNARWHQLFPCYLFVMFVGGLRWGWQGTLVTGGSVIGAVLLGLTTLGRPDQGVTLFRVRMLVMYLAFAVGLQAYFERRGMWLREGIRKLANWPRGVADDIQAAMQDVLSHAVEVMNADRAVVVCEERDEPWLQVARWDSSGLALDRESPDNFEPLVPESLTDLAFLCPRGVESGVAQVSRQGALVEWDGCPVHPRLVPILAGGPLVSAAFHTVNVSGRVFFAGAGIVSSDVMPLAEIVAREMGASLDGLYVAERWRQISIGRERLRLARDLHDGVLQSLTGIRLEVESVASDLGDSGSQAPYKRLCAVERALAREQGELRSFIDGLKHLTRPMTGGAALARSLRIVQERIAAEWRVPVVMKVRPSDLRLSVGVREAVPLMVHESIVNALKHAKPSRVAVDVYTETGQLCIAVSDDGRGFPFHGRYDHAALKEADLGPVSLRERVASLGGTLTIESTPAGSRVEMMLPVTAGGGVSVNPVGPRR